MKWENDVASGEEGPDAAASVAYFSALPFPFGHAVLTHLFPIPVYPTWLTPLVACATRNLASSCQREDYEEGGRRRLKGGGRWNAAAELTLGWEKVVRQGTGEATVRRMERTSDRGSAPSRRRTARATVLYSQFRVRYDVTQESQLHCDIV